MKEKEISELSALGETIAKVDKDLINILATRMCLAKEVVHSKMRHGLPILRKKVEKQRAAQMARWAKEVGLSPEFARVVFYVVLAESCRIQIQAKESAKH